MNFDSSTITSTVPVMVRPMALITRERCIRARTAGLFSVLQQPGPVPQHAELADGEGDEHPDHVELDQCGDVGLEGDDQHDREDGQHDDAVAVGQPVAPGVQLAGQVAVPGQDRARAPGSR